MLVYCHDILVSGDVASGDSGISGDVTSGDVASGGFGGDVISGEYIYKYIIIYIMPLIRMS